MYVPVVIEQYGKGERSYDLYSRLLKDRIVRVDGEITADSASIITSELLFLESQDPHADITMYINSPGGDVCAGFAIYDVMNYKRAVSCISSSYPLSAAKGENCAALCSILFFVCFRTPVHFVWRIASYFEFIYPPSGD